MAVTVYLLHFEPAYRWARHYTGYCQDVDPAARIAAHLRGAGSPLVRAAVQAGCQVRVAAIWREAGQKKEREVKSRSKDFCPVCAPVAHELVARVAS